MLSQQKAHWRSTSVPFSSPPSLSNKRYSCCLNGAQLAARSNRRTRLVLRAQRLLPSNKRFSSNLPKDRGHKYGYRPEGSLVVTTVWKTIKIHRRQKEKETGNSRRVRNVHSFTRSQPAWCLPPELEGRGEDPGGAS